MKAQLGDRFVHVETDLILMVTDIRRGKKGQPERIELSLGTEDYNLEQWEMSADEFGYCVESGELVPYETDGGVL